MFIHCEPKKTPSYINFRKFHGPSFSNFRNTYLGKKEERWESLLPLIGINIHLHVLQEGLCMQRKNKKEYDTILKIMSKQFCPSHVDDFPLEHSLQFIYLFKPKTTFLTFITAY